MLRLYHTGSSVCSQKVRVGLAECNVEWTGHEVDFAAGEQMTPEYLAINPDAVVPVIDDDGLIVRESSLILEYLDEVHGGSRLMPQDRTARVTTKLWLIKGLAVHNAINSVTFATIIRELDLKRSPEQRAARWAKLSDPLVAAKRRDLFENGIASVHVKSAIGVLEQTLETMDLALRDAAWLAGDAYSLSDTCLTSYIDRLDRLGLDILWLSRFDQIGNWLDRVRARQSYKAAIVDFADLPPEGSAKTAVQAVWTGVVRPAA